MSFSSDVKGELARLPVGEACCARSELTSALLCSGGIAWRGRNRYSVTITAADAPIVRRFFALLKKHWGITGEIRTLSGDALHGSQRYQLAVPMEDSQRLLESLSLLDAGALFGLRQAPAVDTVRYSCCRKAFVRGAFLMCGEINPPERGYHIEISAPNEEIAHFLDEQLNYFGINVKITCRKTKFVVYLKQGEAISDMLTLMGASQAMLSLENARVAREVRNRVNRQMNCDASNINRAVNAAEAQIRDILFIDSELGLDKLPQTLRDMALVRANNPETALSELGELLDPPIGKSGVNARLRRITEIADKLRSGEDIELSRPKRGRPRKNGTNE